MQGLFEALNSNDKELAWQYAVALAKRQGEMQSVVSKATDYQMLAMEAIGIRESAPEPDDGEALDPVRAEVRDFMTQTRQQELQRRVNIDPNLGEGPEAQGIDPFGVPDPSAGGEAKAGLRESVIPIDPEGKVKLLVFLDEKVNSSNELSESIRPLKERFKGHTNFSIVGLTRRTYSTNGIKVVGAQLSFPFPLVSGEALALDLRIKSYPTFVFVAVTSQETYRLEGTPSVEEIEKVVKVMRGGR
jgi:thioredoxin-related protein